MVIGGAAVAIALILIAKPSVSGGTGWIVTPNALGRALGMKPSVR